MPRLSDTVPLTGRLQLALRLHSPSRLAQTFAAFSGQFYEPGAFDALARQVGRLYDLESPERAAAFRSQLDRRLCERDRGPVVWDVTNVEDGAA
jgi:hypothetical protein